MESVKTAVWGELGDIPYEVGDDVRDQVLHDVRERVWRPVRRRISEPVFRRLRGDIEFAVRRWVNEKC